MLSVVPSKTLLGGLLHFVAASFTLRPRMKKLLRTEHGWLDFSIGFRTDSGSIRQSITFKKGIATVSDSIPRDVDAIMVFSSDDYVRDMMTSSPGELLNMVMMNKIRTEGNSVVVLMFNYLLGKVTAAASTAGKPEKKKIKGNGSSVSGNGHKPATGDYAERKLHRLTGKRDDPGVKYLEDPYLPEYSISDFPRLEQFLEVHFNQKPEISLERSKIITDWAVKNGFETKKNGEPWIPELRQGAMYRDLMEKKTPIIRENDLLAGTTSEKEIGVMLYPDSHGTMIWSELDSAPTRELNPYDVSEKTRRTLHHYVFPYWMNRNFKNWVGDKYGHPLCQRLDDRFAVYFVWKSAGFSHTIMDYPKILRLGTTGMITEIEAELEKTDTDGRKRHTLNGMIDCLLGLEAYSANLAAEARRQALRHPDPQRKQELEHLAKICERVPREPAKTLDEAVNCVWITWIALHNENSNTGLSIGRLDQWLQPFFEADMENIEGEQQRRDYIRHAIEIVGCLFMRCTDHLPLIPDIGNYLFGGSSSDQAITLGGVRPDGEDAVNDMTYIFLKVTEILAIRDPNVNARFNIEKNSDTYLRRLCEVNLITYATPSMHNDSAMFKALLSEGYPIEDVRDWSAVGCVEPTLSGKHMGHTGCVMFNMIAALEMALNNGHHPLMNWSIGPRTGSIENGDFETFEDFVRAFEAQLTFLMENAITYNNYLGEAHSILRPTPLLSSLIEGCITSGKDATRGGALYNSSGIACIGLADVTDSLMSIKKLVFDEKRFSFAELKEAVNTNFANDSVIQAAMKKKVPKFGSGNEEAAALADRVASFMHDSLSEHKNFRGGNYRSGFWSLANHVAFGTLSGALPSGRMAHKAFTPGLTPEPEASKNLLDNLRDVAALNPVNLNNNMAFNVKVVPSAADSYEKTVDNIFSYVKTYFELGGMQMQLNVVNSDTLRDAMEHPENYRNLLVRISGYNAYFTTLNKDMQIELIERAEYSL